MAIDKTLYDRLGVDESASTQDIKNAFHLLSVQFHPDRTGVQSVKYQEISQAYGVLKDPEKRRLYNEKGMMGLNRLGNQVPNPFTTSRNSQNYPLPVINVLHLLIGILIVVVSIYYFTASSENNQSPQHFTSKTDEIETTSNILKQKEEQMKKDVLQVEKEKEDLNKDKEELNKYRAKLIKDKEELNKDKEELIKDKEELSKDKEQVRKDREELSKDKEQVRKDKEGILREKICLKNFQKQLLESIEKLKKERAGLEAEKVSTWWSDVAENVKQYFGNVVTYEDPSKTDLSGINFLSNLHKQISLLSDCSGE